MSVCQYSEPSDQNKSVNRMSEIVWTRKLGYIANKNLENIKIDKLGSQYGQLKSPLLFIFILGGIMTMTG